ncbi:PHD finger-like domain-containing protein 5A isoform X1 [Cyanistes caeruleus]|uniref:PHD finger-like domain-containing protein 5A isoform X1 n=1 Tax=Cyanistes caeruleus TaxID=156563 RepID=UPI000CDB330B|nr:PHD finger-like domain-containing protein 5A isoform X1 [Cyanistes caeruleus]XP_023790365.1 PHD finger-like domain-containing protein 5A isoform X1 [Cyanistes caeruleus]
MPRPLFLSSLCAVQSCALCLQGTFLQFSCDVYECTGDGKCVICDSYVRPCTLVRICDECNYGSYQGRCVICGGPGVSDAYYCKECTIQEKDRDGCPKIVNLGSSKTDLFYERKKYGFKKR